MFKIILVVASFFLGLACIRLISKFDIHEKEPLPTLFFVTLLGGLCSYGLALFFYKHLSHFGIAGSHNTLGALLVIGPVEETAKLLTFLLSALFLRKKMTEPTDGLIYMSCVALGFSLVENYFYAQFDPALIPLFFIRLFLCTPAHIGFSIFMGLACYMLIQYKVGKKILLVAFLYAALMHGIYDAIAFKGLELLFSIILIRLSYYWVIDLLEFSTAISPHRKSLAEFIRSYDGSREEDGLGCLNCGSKNPKTTYHLEKIGLQKCDQCPGYVCKRDSLFYMLRRFGSKFTHVELPDVSISVEKNLAFFQLDKFNEVLEESNARMKRKFDKEWWFSKSVLKHLHFGGK